MKAKKMVKRKGREVLFGPRKQHFIAEGKAGVNLRKSKAGRKPKQ